MSTVIFRTMAPVLSVVLVAFSLVVLLRGHNAPGGGFIGALIATSAVVIYGVAYGIGEVRRLLRVHPLVIGSAGLLIAGASGLAGLGSGFSYLTGIWLPMSVFGTPGLFDIGVYLTVFGSLAAVVLALEDEGPTS